MGWLVFFLIAGALIAIDLFGFERKAQNPTIKGSILKTAFYVAVSLSFGAWIWIDRGADAGLKFFTGYSLEMSLSFDNVFVISLILGALSIPAAARARVLFFGILGAMVLRGIFIALGAAIVGQFHWVLIGFAAFLIFTGIKMLISPESEETFDIEDNKTLKVIRHYLPVTRHVRGRKFFDRGIMTPLMVALILVEVADVVFAVDSIPATFAITTDPFLVFTSNIFAVVGLRSLFFVLQAMVDRFKYLGSALSLVLVFIGAKVLASQLLGIELPAAISLAMTLFVLCGGVLASLVTGASHRPSQHRP